MLPLDRLMNSHLISSIYHVDQNETLSRLKYMPVLKQITLEKLKESNLNNRLFNAMKGKV